MTGFHQSGEKSLGGRLGLATSILAFGGLGLVALATPSQAEVLLSNFNETASINSVGFYDLRQEFTTGSNASTIQSIQVKSSGTINATDILDLKVEVWTVNTSNQPGVKQFTFTNPASVAVDTDVTFTAPANANVAANTDYFLVIDFDKQWSLDQTESDNQTGATDWSLADSFTKRSNDHAFALWEPTDQTTGTKVTPIPLIKMEGIVRTPGVTLSATMLSVDEDGSGTYTVKLGTQPSRNVTITPSSGDAGAATVSPATLTFTNSNWDTAQTVTVSGAEDDDANDETVTISHSVSGYDGVSTVDGVTVTVTDNDTAGVTVDDTTLSVNEGGSGTYTVVLDTQPSGNVTVTPSSGDAMAATVSPATLIFTNSNWDTAKTVTVTGEDDGDTNNETVTISHRVSAYGTVTTADGVTVTVSDDDTPGVNLSTATVRVDEDGSRTYTVKLNTQHTGNVTITPSSGDTGAATVSPATLTFTTTNWNTAQTVTVSGAQDDDANDATVTISHSVSGYGTVTTANGVTVTVNDDDTAGVTVDSTTLTVTEGGSNTYTVVLDTQHIGNVTVTPSSGDAMAATVSPATLTFANSNWDTPQTVTVSGVDDNDTNNETVTISHRVSGYGSLSTADGVTVTVTDNDTPGVSISATLLPLLEGVSSIYTVVLDTQPRGDVTVTPSSGDEDAATVSPATLTFTASNWNSAQTVTVRGEEDDNANNETVTISHRVSGYGSVSTVDNVTFSVNDNDTAGVTVDDTTLSVNEGGSGTYTVVLDTQPSGNVTVTPSSSDAMAATVSPATLTFTNSNWDTAKTVTVSGEDDTDTNNETVTISHRVSAYGTVTTADGVTVTVSDDDTAGVNLSTATVRVDEGGSGTYTVKLNTQHTGNVTITLSSGDTGAATVSPATLTFTTTNWNTTQTVTVSGAQDADANDETVTISHGVSGYGTVTTADGVTVTVNDDETAGVTVDSTPLTVTEGGSDTYTVVLDTQPSGDVTVTPSSSARANATVAPASLTFTTANWNTAKTVTVTGVDDGDATDDTDETVTISHGVSGYGSVSTASGVTVTVDDNDPGVILSATRLILNEGESGTYTVKLSNLPSGNVTITPSSGPTDKATVGPASLTFTTSNWDTAQTVTVSGEQDADAYRVVVVINHSISGGGYGVVTVDNVEVRIVDDDTAGVSLSETTLSVDEGGTDTYTVTLDTQPRGDVTVTPSSGDEDAATVSPATLTFTASNWDTAQTVTVSGEDDSDTNNETVTISHSVSGYRTTTGSVTTADDVTVTVVDDDSPPPPNPTPPITPDPTPPVIPDPTPDDVSLSATTLRVDEGGSQTYTVELKIQPGGDVTITPSSSATANATVVPPSLTFTTANWNTAQTVTVRGVPDDDANNETVTIRHGVRGYGTVTTANGVTVTVDDDDTAGVTVDSTRLTVTEGGSDTYTVKLDTQPSGNVTVTPSSGDAMAATVSPATLTFTASNWDTAKTVTVRGVEDADASNETVTVRHRVSGYGSVTTAKDVTVTVNDDGWSTGEDVLKGLLPRFGRSVAQQVLDRVRRRLQRPSPPPGLEVSVAGERLSNRGPWEEEQGIMAKLLGFEPISEGQLVEGTEFAFSPHQQQEQEQEHGDGDGDGESLAFWGAGELGSFSSQQGDISLSGDVTTALVAADWHRQRWQAGAAVAYGWGKGSYEESSSSNEGELNANLTGLFPYGSYALNDHLSIWGVVGHSWGHLTLSPEGAEQQSTDIRMAMGALGLDGLLLDGGDDGVTIRSSADALLLGVSSEETPSLAGEQGQVSRLRLGLEAERPFPLPRNDAVLTPSVELGLRRDAVDAQTGVGMDLAAALRWSDPLKGMEMELRGRTMVSHGEQSFHEQGLGLSLSWDPNPSSSLGPSLSLSQRVGASAASGSHALLVSTPWPELIASGSAAEGQQQFAARMGYGFLVYNDALLITPEVGVSLSSDDGATSLGFSLSPYSQQGDDDSWKVILESQQHISGNGDNSSTQHPLDLRFSLLF